MVKIQLTKEFIKWFTKEMELVTDEPIEVAQEFVNQLYLTGCFAELTSGLEAENAKLREALEGMLRIFDRGIGPGMIGRLICDKAREALGEDTK